MFPQNRASTHGMNDVCLQLS